MDTAWKLHKARESYIDKVRRRFVQLRDESKMDERQAAILACNEHDAGQASVGLPHHKAE